MSEQNFSNHTRMVPLFHYVAFTAALFPFVVSVIHFFKTLSAGSGRLQAAAMVALVVAVILALWHARLFSLKAQDRAIRAEENFRHFQITGKNLPATLRMPQIVALRFASDAEFVALAQKAATEQLSNKAIKQSIQNWRADNNRV